MKLIIWLWNPWLQYKNTRHNVWFMFLDYFAEKNWFEDFKIESKFKAEISSWNYLWEKTILLKPQTFMNLSWESIRKIIDFYKIPVTDLLVIYDDMSMDFWKTRFRDTGSAGWHNWVKSMIAHLWNEFPRIKVWVWFNDNFEVSDWVLSKFTSEEIDLLESEIFEKISEILKEKI